jgi:hypothetical protein
LKTEEKRIFQKNEKILEKFRQNGKNSSTYILRSNAGGEQMNEKQMEEYVLKDFEDILSYYKCKGIFDSIEESPIMKSLARKVALDSLSLIRKRNPQIRKIPSPRARRSLPATLNATPELYAPPRASAR